MSSPPKANEISTIPRKSKPKARISIAPPEQKDAKNSTISYNLLENKQLVERIKRIHHSIKHYLDSNRGTPSVLYEAAYHLIRGGGKRLRSLLTLLACEAVNGDSEKALKVALAAELVQTASLISDDLIDDDDYRRGVETVHRKFGNDIAILACNLLIGQAIRITAEVGMPELLVQMAIGGIRMCEGEAQDIHMNLENPNKFNEDAYFEMVANKTVAFMRQATLVGALIGGASDSQIHALTSYAEALGYTFQLRDDILDINAAPEQAPKTTYSDLRMKRGNIVVIHALAVSEENKRALCLRAMDAGDFAPILQLIEETNSSEYTLNLAKTFNKQAKKALQGQGLALETLLINLADYALFRTH
ncbi:MAG: polyprenyl synthetase family protein [Candidatus Thorarchaeota archaeon]